MHKADGRMKVVGDSFAYGGKNQIGDKGRSFRATIFIDMIMAVQSDGIRLGIVRSLVCVSE